MTCLVRGERDPVSQSSVPGVRLKSTPDSFLGASWGCECWWVEHRDGKRNPIRDFIRDARSDKLKQSFKYLGRVLNFLHCRMAPMLDNQHVAVTEEWRNTESVFYQIGRASCRER